MALGILVIFLHARGPLAIKYSFWAFCFDGTEMAGTAKQEPAPAFRADKAGAMDVDGGDAQAAGGYSGQPAQRIPVARDRAGRTRRGEATTTARARRNSIRRAPPPGAYTLQLQQQQQAESGSAWTAAGQFTQKKLCR